MTILSGLTISTLGMRAQTRALHVIGTNVSNVQTGGFRRADPHFQTVMSETRFEQSDIGGTRTKILQRNTIPGNLLQTGDFLDLAILGGGFFVTRTTLDESGELIYTRDGNFSTRIMNDITVTDAQTGETFQTKDAYIVDKNGNFVLGHPANADGTFSKGTLVPMRVDRNVFIEQGTPTTRAALRLNLNSNAAIVPDHLQAISNLDGIGGRRADGMETPSIRYVDSNGIRQTARLNFTKAANHQWDVSATYNGAGSAQIDEIKLLGEVIEAGDSYTVTVGDQAVSYTAMDGETMTEVVAGLIDALNADPVVAELATASVGSSPGTIRLTGKTEGETFTSSASGANGPDIAQVEEVTLGGDVRAGQRFELMIGETIVSYTATDADTSLADIASGLIAGINANATTSALVAAVPGASPGSITLTGVTAGTAFNVTGAATRSDLVSFSGTVEAGDVYSIRVDGNTISYTATGAEASLAEIRDQMIAQINADPATSATVTALPGTADGDIILTAVAADSDFAATSSVVNGGAVDDNETAIMALAGGSFAIQTTTPALAAVDDNTASSSTIFTAQSVLTTTPVTRLDFGDGDGILRSPKSIPFEFTQPATETAAAATATFDLDISGLHQFGAKFLFNGYTDDGYDASALEHVTFDDLGHVVGISANKQEREFYQIPLAKFRNPDALETRNGQAFTETEKSGEPVIETIEDSGIATFAPGVRELSNVLLPDEFSSLIRTQQAYNSSATAFKTVDEMLQTVAQMKR